MTKIYTLSLTNNPEYIYTEGYDSFEEAKDVAFKLMKASQSKYPSKAINQLVSDHKIKGNSPYYEDYISGVNDDYDEIFPIKSLYIIESEYAEVPDDLGSYVIEYLRDWAWDEGGENGEDYLDDVSDIDRQRLNDYLEHWFKKRYAPNWFNSYAYKKVSLDEEEK